MRAWVFVVCCIAAGAQEEPIAKFGTTVIIPDGLRGEIYFLKPNAERLPNFRKLKSVGAVYTTSLNVPPQDFDQGFPGVSQRFEWFAIDYTGKFWVQYAGIHRFLLLSDDGSRLYVDGKLIIDNDGVHAAHEEYGEANLDAGPHRIEVQYFQGPRFHVALVLKIAAPGERMRVFNVDRYKPPAGVEVPVEQEPAGKDRKRRK